LFILQRFAPVKQFGVDLGQFFQAFPKSLISRHPLLAVVLLGGGFEEELQDAAWNQTAGQIIKGAVLLSPGTSAVVLAAGGETFDVGSAQEIRGNGQLTQARGFAPAQGQGGSAAEPVYLGQYVGEDTKPKPSGQKKENAARLQTQANLLNSLKTKQQLYEAEKTCETAA
jgi:hypothetical protein